MQPQIVARPLVTFTPAGLPNYQHLPSKQRQHGVCGLVQLLRVEGLEQNHLRVRAGGAGVGGSGHRGVSAVHFHSRRLRSCDNYVTGEAPTQKTD